MRRTLALFSLALAVLPLACGGESVSPQAAVAAAAAKTEDAASARIEFTGGLTGSEGSFTIVGRGEFANQRGRMTLDLFGVGGHSASMQMIFDELVIYMRFPPGLGAELPGGKSWVKMDLEALGKQQGIDLGELTQFGQTNPTQSLWFLQGASDDFEEVGEEEVRGVGTTHYRGTVDLRKAAEQISEAARTTAERLIELMGVSKLPFEVWIDDEGLARRIKYEQPLPAAAGEDASMTLTMDFFDFGVDVDVEPPPESEVTDIQELLNQRKA